jgi:hypothetical protein
MRVYEASSFVSFIVLFRTSWEDQKSSRFMSSAWLARLHSSHVILLHLNNTSFSNYNKENLRISITYYTMNLYSFIHDLKNNIHIIIIIDLTQIRTQRKLREDNYATGYTVLIPSFL